MTNISHMIVGDINSNKGIYYYHGQKHRGTGGTISKKV